MTFGIEYFKKSLSVKSDKKLGLKINKKELFIRSILSSVLKKKREEKKKVIKTE